MWGVWFVGGLVVPWVIWKLFVKKRLPVTVTVDADDPRPADVARYFAEIAARLDEHPERMRIVVDAPDGMALDLEPDGRMAIRMPGRRTFHFDLRGRWIADHPVPFPLGPAKMSRFLRIFRSRRLPVLYVDPVDANRFRVTDHLPFAVPISVYVLLSLAAVLAVVLVSPHLLALVVGAVVGCVLPQQINIAHAHYFFVCASLLGKIRL
jgi:hypothetical protein